MHSGDNGVCRTVVHQYFHIGYGNKEKWKYVTRKPAQELVNMRDKAWKQIASCCANTARIPRPPEHAAIYKASECRNAVVEVMPAFALMTKVSRPDLYDAEHKKLHDNLMFFVTAVKLIGNYSTKAIPEVNIIPHILMLTIYTISKCVI